MQTWRKDILLFEDAFDTSKAKDLIVNAEQDSASAKPTVDADLFESFNKAITAYMTRYQYGCNLNDSGYRMLRYQVGQQSDIHYDDSSNLVSSILFLNDDFVGGELYFPIQKIRVKPKAGTVVVFPSNFIYPYSSKPVKTGTKYEIVTWFSEATKENK